MYSINRGVVIRASEFFIKDGYSVSVDTHFLYLCGLKIKEKFFSKIKR